MRRMIEWGLAAALVAMPIGAAAAAAKDTVVIGHTLEPPGLDPTAGAAAPIRYITYVNLYEGLVHVLEDGSVAPLLAESWTISDDAKVYTFKLRQGVEFHDGSPFDCSNVKFSYERAVAPDSTNAQKGLFEPIEKTECPDPVTAVVTLKRPASNFLFNMAWGDAVMMSPASVDNNKTDPVGTGPFRFKEWVKGDKVVLERNPDYWGEPAKLSQVTFKFIADPSAVPQVARDLRYIGLDNLGGYFDLSVFDAWRKAGDPLQHYEVASPAQIAEQVAAGQVTVVDVRQNDEWQSGHIREARHIMLGYLPERLAEIPADKPVVVQCRSGARSAIGASILQARGIPRVINLLGGIKAWTAAGLPVEPA